MLNLLKLIFLLAQSATTSVGKEWNMVICCLNYKILDLKESPYWVLMPKFWIDYSGEGIKASSRPSNLPGDCTMQSVLEVPGCTALWKDLGNFFKKVWCLGPGSKHSNLVLLDCGLGIMVFKDPLDESIGWNGCLHQSPANSSTLFVLLFQIWANCSSLVLLLHLDVAAQSFWYHHLLSALSSHFHFDTS